MIGKIFQFFQYKRMLKEVKTNPENFSDEQTKEIIYSLGILPIIISLVVLILLFLFGFTHVITSPSGIAKFFFFIIFFGTLLFWILLRKVAQISGKIAKKTTSSIKNSLKKENVKIHNGEFTIK